MRDEFVLVDGVRLHVVDYGGEGRTLILCHGTGLPARVWDELAPAFRQHFHTFAYDRAGQGDSDKPADGYSMDSYGVEFAGLCAALGLRDVDAVGHSAGGTLLAFASLQAPGLLRRGVMIDPILFGPPPQGRQDEPPSIAARIARRRYEWPGRQAMFDSMRTRAPYDTWTAASLWAYVEHGTDLLEDGTAQLKCLPWIEARMYGSRTSLPINEAFARATSSFRIIRAGSTDRVPGAAAEAAIAAAKDATLTTMSGVTHFAPMEQPAAVAALCVQLLLE